MPPRIDWSLVDELYVAAHAVRWQLPAERFAHALETSAAKAFADQAAAPHDLEHYLRSLRLDDLALACACAAGTESAWDHFVLEYRPVLYRAADALDPGGGARELADALYADLFGIRERGEERQSLLRYFHGRSSLATWLRAVLAQRQVDRARARSRTAPLPELEPRALHVQPYAPERTRYIETFQTAFRAAVARLAPRDRLRLSYYYAQGLTLADVGRLLHEHESSASRHLAATRTALRRDVEQQLRESAFSPDEIASCFDSVTEDAGPLDLDHLLGGQDARSSGSVVQHAERTGPVEEPS